MSYKIKIDVKLEFKNTKEYGFIEQYVLPYSEPSFFMWSPRIGLRIVPIFI